MRPCRRRKRGYGVPDKTPRREVAAWSRRRAGLELFGVAVALAADVKSGVSTSSHPAEAGRDDNQAIPDREVLEGGAVDRLEPSAGFEGDDLVVPGATARRVVLGASASLRLSTL